MESAARRTLKILHVGASDLNGGAARAAYRIHRSLCASGPNHGLFSQMRVIHQRSDDPSVIGGPPAGQGPLRRRLNLRLRQLRSSGFRTANPTLHSIAWPASGLGAELTLRYQRGQVDLVHLHWLGDETLSVGEIGRLPLPLVWTLHDQWPFCGAEHYTSPPAVDLSSSDDERFIHGYTALNRPHHEAGPDLNRRTWQRKRVCWHRPMQIICPSAWMADCARRSALMADWPITVIPNPLDLQVWAPLDQGQARRILHLPEDRPLVLFGALGGTLDPRKGADLLMQALQILRRQVEGTPLEALELLVFGQSQPKVAADLGFPVRYLGRLSDDVSLRVLYAAADVMVVPSRQEAFGQTASEAHACGTPVVAFATGGLLDIVADRVTGALADPFQVESLAQAIHWVIEDPVRRRQLAQSARDRAVRFWGLERAASLYEAVYQRALANC